MNTKQKIAELQSQICQLQRENANVQSLAAVNELYAYANALSKGPHMTTSQNLTVDVDRFVRSGYNDINWLTSNGVSVPVEALKSGQVSEEYFLEQSGQKNYLQHLKNLLRY